MREGKEERGRGKEGKRERERMRMNVLVLLGGGQPFLVHLLVKSWHLKLTLRGGVSLRTKGPECLPPFTSRGLLKR